MEGGPEAGLYAYTRLIRLLYSRSDTAMESRYSPIIRKEKSSAGRCMGDSDRKLSVTVLNANTVLTQT